MQGAVALGWGGGLGARVTRGKTRVLTALGLALLLGFLAGESRAAGDVQNLEVESLDLLLHLKAGAAATSDSPFPVELDGESLARVLFAAEDRTIAFPTRSLRILAAVAFLGGRADAAPALATAAGDLTLSSLYQATLQGDEPAGQLSLSVLNQALDEAGHRGWLRLALGQRLGERLGDAECRDRTRAAFAPRHRVQTALVGGVVGLGALLAIIGLLLGLASPWLLPRLALPPPPDGAAFHPGLARVGLVLGLWFLVFVATSLLAALLPEVLGYSPGLEWRVAPQSLLTGLIALLLLSRIALRRTPTETGEGPDLLGAIGWRHALGGRRLLLVLALFAVAIPLTLGASLLSEHLFGSGELNPLIGRLIDSPRVETFLVSLVAVGLFAPVFEEILFRGYLFPVLRARMGILGAAFTSGGLFALLHMDLGTLLPLWLLGVLFALAREWTGSLRGAILLHALWNTGNILVILTLVY